MTPYEEPIPIDLAKFMLSKKDDFIIKEYFKQEEKDSDGNEYTPEQYVNSLKKWLKKTIASKGKSITQYKYSKALKTQGREYVKTFGIQSLQHNIRSFLCEGKYLDFDMKNAQPTILKYLLAKHFPEHKFKFLDYYIKNRQDCLDQYFTKRDVLVWLNSDDIYKKQNDMSNGLIKEFDSIRRLFWDNKFEEYKSIPRIMKKNKRASYLNKILCIWESRILNESIKDIENVSVKMFDGFMTYDDIKAKESNLLKLNKITEKYKVEWACKPFKHDIVMDVNAPPSYEADPLDYEVVKEEFEKIHFMTEAPIQFYRVDNNKVEPYNLQDFKILNKPFKCNKLSLGHIVKTEFVSEWLEDVERRSFKQVIFVPDTNYSNPKHFNTFMGFDNAKLLEGRDWNYEGLNIFREHIGLLCDNNEIQVKYLEDWLADLFQNPAINPQICIVINSMKGVGKDLLFKYITAILGLDFTHETEDIENEIFGKHNGILMNKVLLKLDEMSGANGFKYKERIKSTLTQGIFTIKEKYTKAITTPNILRWMIFSNNDNPIEVTGDNRRFWVVKSGHKKEPEYYTKLFQNMKDKNILYSIYSYYKTRDISNVDLRLFPETEKMKLMAEHNTLPIYPYLYDTFININNSSLEYQETEVGIAVFPFDFISNYKLYLDENSLTHNYLSDKEFKRLLVNIQTQPIKFKQSREMKLKRAYFVDKDKLIKELDRQYKFSENIVD